MNARTYHWARGPSFRDVGKSTPSQHAKASCTASTFGFTLKLDSLTAGYLNNTLKIEVPKKRRTFSNAIKIKGAREHNLQNIDATFPIGLFTAVTGVSGSGKSTLVKKILYTALQKKIGAQANKPGQFSTIEGDFSSINTVEFIDQNPIGRSSRSNPVTYIKAYDDIRSLFAKQKLSDIRGYKTKHFSFNVDGGRCETCKGEGEITIEMQFMDKFCKFMKCFAQTLLFSE